MKKILILLALIGLGTVMAAMHYAFSDISFSIVTKSNNNAFRQYQSTAILANQLVSGEFTAGYDNLGIVLIRFNTFHRNNHDQIIFRLREKGQKNWYYENQYDALQLEDEIPYPFGFPVIEKSQGKQYEFVIVSTAGQPGNAVAISHQRPIIMTKYQYPRKEMVALLKYKLVSGIENSNLIFAAIVFFTPLFLFVFRQKQFAIPIVVLLVIYDLLFVRNIYDGVILTLTACLAFLTKKSFAFALVFLIVCLLTNLEKAAIYAFVLLTFGFGQSIIELRLWKN